MQHHLLSRNMEQSWLQGPLKDSADTPEHSWVKLQKFPAIFQ